MKHTLVICGFLVLFLAVATSHPINPQEKIVAQQLIENIKKKEFKGKNIIFLHSSVLFHESALS